MNWIKWKICLLHNLKLHQDFNKSSIGQIFLVAQKYNMKIFLNVSANTLKKFVIKYKIINCNLNFLL